MKRHIFFSILTISLFLCVELNAQQTHTETPQFDYGYCPNSFNKADEFQGQGSGKNGFMEVATLLDPQSDPAFLRMSGKKIIGVKVYLTSDYEQMDQELSSIIVRKGNLTATPIRKYADFVRGWNEIYFDNPISIDANTKYYIGAEVYETRAKPYPFISVKNAPIKGTFFVNINRKQKWEDYYQRGPILIQAIIKGNDNVINRTATAIITQMPTINLPGKKTPAKVYIKNYSNTPIQKIQVDVYNADKKVSTTSSTLSPKLQPYDGRIIDLNIQLGSQQGNEVPYSLAIVQIDGHETQAAYRPSTNVYVSKDAFKRVVVIEEFTSQYCPNCPFMAYYMQKAKEQTKVPHIFITHHTGFTEDNFTSEVDRQMLYFFENHSFNPAVMFDRTILKGNQTPIIGAREASPEPYLANIMEAAKQPALAQILVDIRKIFNQVECTVHGKISDYVLNDHTEVYLSTYLIEDKISFKKFPQQGPKDTDKGVPTDLWQVIGGHNGIIRKNLSSIPLGDRLTTRADGTFYVTYPEFSLDSDWNWTNCQVVAFIHKIDKKNLSNNQILNGGSSKFDTYLEIKAPKATPPKAKIYISKSGQLSISGIDQNSLRIYTIDGQSIDPRSGSLKGIYILRYSVDGKYISQKISI